MTSRSRLRLGVVIPTLDEAGHLPGLLDDLRRLRVPKRVVVVDGGSVDGTTDLARDAGARVLCSPPGRGLQLQTGVQALRAPWLLLLHADSRLPPESCRVLEDWLAQADPEQVGYFRFCIDAPGLAWRALEQGQRLRESLLGLVFGDQGLLVHRSRLLEAGGIPDLPLMEDVELIRRLRRGGPVVRIPADLPTSARRYRREGPLAPLRNAALLVLHHLGVPLSRLARWYPREPAPARNPAGRRTLVVFARAPLQGRVKTRLAAGIGPEAALAVYRTMGRKVVDQVRSGPWQVVVLYDPPGEQRLVSDWLGAADVQFRPQASGDLGERMHSAIEGEFARGATAVCVVGTDAPDLDRGLVGEAFTALDRGADVVFGPAEDGGYYLVAVRASWPGLFGGIPWSTDRVLSLSLAHCRRAGMEVVLLRTLRDVDTRADLEASGLATPPPRG